MKEKNFGTDRTTKVSKEFLVRLKLHEEPAYAICQEVDVHYSTLSRLIHQIDPVRPNDAKIIAVGRVLGLEPEECFEEPPSNGKVNRGCRKRKLTEDHS